MSEHILRILLSELQTARVICQKCGTIVEAPLSKLEEKFHDNCCLSCKTPFHNLNMGQVSPHTLAQLGNIIQRLNDQERLRIEFVLPVKE